MLGAIAILHARFDQRASVRILPETGSKKSMRQLTAVIRVYNGGKMGKTMRVGFFVSKKISGAREDQRWKNKKRN